MKKKIFTPYEIVNDFECAVAEYAGSKYAVAVDSCCNALFLCCKYLEVKTVTLPDYTYPGVACAVINAGGKVKFKEFYWEDDYKLEPYNIWDGALKFSPGMYMKDSFYCLSFHNKKLIPIGRGGMILLNDKKAYEWFKKARFDGRKAVPLKEDRIEMVGWNCYMTPEQASRGLTLLQCYKNNRRLYSWEQGYPILKKIKAYTRIK